MSSRPGITATRAQRALSRHGRYLPWQVWEPQAQEREMMKPRQPVLLPSRTGELCTIMCSSLWRLGAIHSCPEGPTCSSFSPYAASSEKGTGLWMSSQVERPILITSCAPCKSHHCSKVTGARVMAGYGATQVLQTLIAHLSLAEAAF